MSELVGTWSTVESHGTKTDTVEEGICFNTSDFCRLFNLFLTSVCNKPLSERESMSEAMSDAFSEHTSFTRDETDEMKQMNHFRVRFRHHCHYRHLHHQYNPLLRDHSQCYPIQYFF